MKIRVVIDDLGRVTAFVKKTRPFEGRSRVVQADSVDGLKSSLGKAVAGMRQSTSLALPGTLL